MNPTDTSSTQSTDASTLVPYIFEKHSIRVVIGYDGEPEFVAKDVAEALDYSWQANVIGHVPEKWKGVKPVNTPGGVQQMSVLTESGLYFFVGRSDKPMAIPFQEWLAGDVMPSIRKTGSYSVQAAAPLPVLSPEHQALVTLLYEGAALKAEQTAQAQVQAQQAEVQAQQADALAQVDQRVTNMADTMLMQARPAGSESIVHIRERINKLHGLPARIVDEILRQSPLAPKPAGMVKSSHADALGASYAVYWTKDINAVFARFVAECQRVTPTLATHPYVQGRFKLASPVDARPPGTQFILI